MQLSDLLDRLWNQYTELNPSTAQIHDLFTGMGERVVNDHIAFRTYSDPRVGIEVLARPFREAGYVPKGEYQFKEKKLRARHFELPGSPDAPRVFISELLLDQFSKKFRKAVKELLDTIPAGVLEANDLILRGSLFSTLRYSLYTRLREESEYAAWVYVFGYRANHFTVSVNHLKQFKGIREVNALLKEKGFPLNHSGGEVKGSAGQMLEQSSTLADQVEISFSEGAFRIPACYYEFAMRYPDPEGTLFSGFIAGSADKIFESTDYRKS